MAKKKPTLTYGRPQYATLEEYKNFIKTMLKSIAPDAPESSMTEEEWEENYKEFIEELKKGEEENAQEDPKDGE